MADSHLGPHLALAPPTPAEGHLPASTASLYSPLVYPGSQASQCSQSIQMFLPSPFAQPAGGMDRGPAAPAPAQEQPRPELGMLTNGFAALPVQSAAASSQGPNSQALMGVLGLLQQNIGALQALVPLLAGPQNQQQQQVLQQLPQPGSGMVSTISQLASATASIIPQLGMAVQQQQQQQQQQQPLGAPAHAFPPPAVPPHMQQHQGQQTEEPALKLMMGSSGTPSRAPAAVSDREATLKQPRGEGPFGGSFAAEAVKPNAPKALVASPLDSGENEDGDENSPLDGDFAEEEDMPSRPYDIVEMDPVEILAEHTHFCEICGKGFKRDANLRMHMRGHGDEYKTPSALARPDKPGPEEVQARRKRRFSCPYVGCKRNQQHRRFTPLKTMLCVKNHYRRSHCPKMLTCSKCSVKRFSVVADLRTHEKHCGKERWLCSCGTSFSRKDKLLGHLALFTGHSAAAPSDGEDFQALPLPATSTSGGSRARDCISSSFNLNQPTGDDADMEREVVLYERQSASPKDPRNSNAYYQQRPPVRTANYLS